MGRIAKLLSFVRVTPTEEGATAVSDATADRGGGDNRTAQHYTAPGDDAYPLPGDYTHLEAQAGTGRDSALGYVDPLNLQLSEPGDKRIYARSPATGEQVVDVWLKADGSATVTTPVSVFECRADGAIKGGNDNGSFELQADGVVVINGVTIDTDGTITTPAAVISPSVIAAGKELAGHDHKAGTPPGMTGPNL